VEASCIYFSSMFSRCFSVAYSSQYLNTFEYNKCLRHGMTLALKNTCSLGGAFNHIFFFSLFVSNKFFTNISTQPK